MENTSSFENFDNKVMPANNMALAIVGTVLGLCSPCCIGLVLGIIAIVMASQVKNKFESGDIAGANSSAKNAKILGIIAIAIAILNIIYIGINFEDTIEQYQLIMEQYNLNN